MATTAEIITQLYVGYYDRAPDPAGLNYWVGRYNAGMTLGQIAQSFAVQTESTSKYPYLANPNIASSTTFITTIYQNLFGRAPDAAGLAYWQGQLATGGLARVGTMIIDIISGAQGDDKTIINNKVQVGVYWAQKTAEVAGFNYDGAAAASAETVLDTVTKDAATVTTAKAAADTFAAGGASSGNTFTLTDAAAVLTESTSSKVTPTGNLTTASDKIDALNLLAGTTIIKDASTTDNDKLSAIVSAAVAPLVTNIETIDLTFTGAAGDLQMTNIIGAKNVSVNGASSATAAKISGLSATAAPTITLGATSAVVTTSQTTHAGTADVLNVTLAGSKGGLTVDAAAAGALETLNLVSGTSANTLTVAMGATSTGVTKTVVTGASDLTLIGAVDGQLSGTAKFAAIDASAHTGVFTIQSGANSAVTTVTDTAIAVGNYKGLDKVVLNDNTVVSVTGASSGLVVGLNSDLAFATFTVAGSSSVSDAASNADSVTVNLTGAKATSDVTGALTFTGFETLNLSSTVIDHTVGTLTTTGSATALDTVNITGDKDLTLTNAPAGVEKIDASAFTGKLVMGAAGTALLSLTGGAGADTLYSGGNATSATVVDAGAGNDTIVFGAEKDNVKGGAGADIFNISTLANIIRADGDVIQDFTSATDTFKVGATVKAATTAGTLTVQNLTFNTDLATTLGAGTYTADAAHLVKVTNSGTDTYYLVVNDNTAAYADGTDGVVQLTGVTALTTADFIA